MSFNIIDSVKDQLSGQLLDQISGLLGEAPDKTATAVSGLVPAILSGLGKMTNHQHGLESLFNTVQAQDESLLNNPGDILGSDDSVSLIEMGAKLLAGLVGSGSMARLIDSLAGFSGIAKNSSSGLVGIITPIVLGILKRKIFGGHTDAEIGTLASLFSDQMQNIENALPEALRDQLESEGFFESISENFSESAEVTPRVVQEQVSHSPGRGSPLLRKLVPLIVLAIIGWLALHFF